MHATAEIARRLKRRTSRSLLKLSSWPSKLGVAVIGRIGRLSPFPSLVSGMPYQITVDFEEWLNEDAPPSPTHSVDTVSTQMNEEPKTKSDANDGGSDADCCRTAADKAVAARAAADKAAIAAKAATEKASAAAAKLDSIERVTKPTGQLVDCMSPRLSAQLEDFLVGPGDLTDLLEDEASSVLNDALGEVFKMKSPENSARASVLDARVETSAAGQVRSQPIRRDRSPAAQRDAFPAGRKVARASPSSNACGKFVCDALGCGKEYQSVDALRKHNRKNHRA